MQRNDDQRFPDELISVAERLRAERPTMTAIELDRVMVRVEERATRRSRRKEPLMRSRISIVSMLVLGAFLTLGGAALSFSGPSASRNAATAQYGHHHHHHNNNNGNNNNNDNNNDGGGEVLGTSQSAPATSSPGPSQGVLGETARPTAEAQPAQAARQVQSTGARQLPFTGYAAIPIMVLGLALLALGLLMRRMRTRADLS